MVTPSPPHGHALHNPKALYATGGVLLIVLYLFMAWQLVDSRRTLEQAAATNVANLADLLSNRVYTGLHDIDLAFDDLIEQVHHETLFAGEMPGPDTLKNILLRKAPRLGAVENLIVVNAQGQVLSKTQQGPGFNIADREHFRALQANPQRGLVISEPLELRSLKKPGVVLGQAHAQSHGQMDWAVLAAVPADWFNAHLQQVKVGSNGVVTITTQINNRARLLARIPQPQYMPVGYTYKAGWQKTPGPVAGTIFATSGGDGLVRIYALRDLPDYPLQIAVGVAQKDYLAGWYQELWAYLIGGLLLAVLSGMLVWLLRSNRHHIEALSASEVRNRTMVASLFEGLVLQDAKGTILSTNASACRILGLSYEQLAGRSSLDPGWRCIREDGSTYPGAEHPAMEALRSGQDVMDAVMGVYHPDGKLVWIEINAKPIFQNPGEPPVAVVCSFVDITERKAMLQQLEDTVLVLNEAQRIGKIGSWEWSVPIDSIFWSEQLYRMIGLDPTQPPPSYTAHRNIYPPESWDALNAAVEEAIHRGTSFSLELQFHRADQSTGWALVTGEPIQDSKGFIIKLRGTFQDITERKLNRLAAEDAQTALQGVIDAASKFAIIACDLNGIVTLFNKGAEQMLGYSAFEVTQIASLARFHLDEELETHGAFLEGRFGRPAPGYNAIVEMARYGKTDSREWTYRRKDGSRLPVQLVVTPIYNATAQIIGFLCVGKDIRADKALLQSLSEAKEKAEAANRAKSEFVANMSHEIRTPMNGVIGMTELALRTVLTREQREYLTTARDSAKSLLRVINDILDFSKIEAGKLELLPRPFELRREIGIFIRTLASSIHAKGLSLTLHIDPAIPGVVVGDADRLRQVLVNLVGNAEKFTPKGAIRVHISHAGSDEQGLTIHCRVQDTGVGIPEQKRQQIFEAFSQVDSSTTRRYGGTGLGLSICRQLVGMMGGRIWVESELGVGSTFHFTVCFAHAANPRAQAAPVLAALPGQQVLVLGGDVPSRQILDEMLSGWQMQVSLQTDSDSAQAALAASATLPDLILLVDPIAGESLALVEAIRNAARQGCPVMMLSSAPISATSTRHKALGVQHHLQQPIIEAELLAVLQEIYPAAEASPVVSGDAPTDLPPAPAAEAAASPAGKLRILLAEDNPVNQQLATLILESHGHQVVIAENGQVAVDRFAAEAAKAYDVIVMDVEMPVMDGYTATRRIRALEAGTGQHIRIVAATAYAMDSDRQRAQEAGMDDYLCKPYQIEDLLAMVEARSAPTPEADREVSSVVEVNVPPFDHAVALSRAMGKPEFLVELAGIFLRDIPDAQMEFRAAIESRDSLRLHRAAHRMKGSVGNFGAAPSVAAATALQDLADSGDWARIEEVYRNLCQALDTLTLALQTLEKETAGHA